MSKLFLFFFIVITSCTKADYNATFIGFDTRKCGCCWGYEITLDNGDKVIGSKFSESLNNFTTRQFPFKGNIVFKKHASCDNVIEIESFEEVPK